MPLFSRVPPRIKAGLAHLGISALVGLCSIALIYLIWYPGPLSTAQGVGQVAVLLIAVDVVLGPLITTVVFNRAKRSLPLDLAVIACLQLGALIYGLHSIFVARPVVLAFNIDRFDVVNAVDIDQESLAKALAAGKPDMPWFGPRTVVAERPTNRKDRTRILFSGALGGPDLPQMPEWYVPYASATKTVIPRIRPLSELRTVNQMDDASWKAFTDSLPQPESEVGYLPMRAKAKDGVVVVNRQTAEILKIVLLEPQW